MGQVQVFPLWQRDIGITPLGRISIDEDLSFELLNNIYNNSDFINIDPLLFRYRSCH